jgi:hypothetical protein
MDNIKYNAGYLVDYPWVFIGTLIAIGSILLMIRIYV